LSTSPKLVPGSSAVGSSASHETLNQSFGLPRFPLNKHWTLHYQVPTTINRTYQICLGDKLDPEDVCIYIRNLLLCLPSSGTSVYQRDQHKFVS